MDFAFRDEARIKRAVFTRRQDEGNRGCASDGFGFSCSSVRSGRIPRFVRGDASGARAPNEKRENGPRRRFERAYNTHTYVGTHVRARVVRARVRPRNGTKRNGTERRGDRGRPRGSRGERAEKRHARTHTHAHAVMALTLTTRVERTTCRRRRCREARCR